MNTKQTILTHFNFKGGSSKTCLNLSFALQYCANYPDKRVLFIDADAQSNATRFILGSKYIRKNLYTIQDGILDNVPISELIVDSPLENYPNFDTIPSCLDMLTLNKKLSVRPFHETLLQKYLNREESKSALSKYDLIIFDLNPDFSETNTNVLLCCTDIIPLINYGCTLSLDGYISLINIYEGILEGANRTDNVLRKPVITKFVKKANTVINEWIDEAEENNIFGNTFKQTMRRSTHYENAVRLNIDIKTYIKTNKIRTDIEDEIDNLINEYIENNILEI